MIIKINDEVENTTPFHVIKKMLYFYLRGKRNHMEEILQDLGFYRNYGAKISRFYEERNAEEGIIIFNDVSACHIKKNYPHKYLIDYINEILFEKRESLGIVRYATLEDKRTLQSKSLPSNQPSHYSFQIPYDFQGIKIVFNGEKEVENV